jgi:hypothetical protein
MSARTASNAKMSGVSVDALDGQQPRGWVAEGPKGVGRRRAGKEEPVEVGGVIQVMAG